MEAALIDETHLWPEGSVIGFDCGSGDDRTVYLHFEPGRVLWTPLDVSRWFKVPYRLLTGDWTAAQHRRRAQRFIREEVARRRMERWLR